ncbi:hypothetical protein [Thermaerobacter litoralis]
MAAAARRAVALAVAVLAVLGTTVGVLLAAAWLDPVPVGAAGTGPKPPDVVAGIAAGGLVPAPGEDAPAVEVTRLVLVVDVRAEEAQLSLLPVRVTAALEARYSLRLDGSAREPQRVALRFLAPAETVVQWDGRPVDLYPTVYPGPEPTPAAGGSAALPGLPGTGEGTGAPASPAAPGEAGSDEPAAGGGPLGGEPVADAARGAGAAGGLGAAQAPGAETLAQTLWLDPLTGRFYPVREAARLGTAQALGTDVTMRPGQVHQLLLRFPRIGLGWDDQRYLSPAYQMVIPVHPSAWPAFGPVEVHVSLPPGFAAAVAGSTGAGEAAAQGRYAYGKWTAPPDVVHVAATATAGMWGRLVTDRRDVFWLLVVTWLVFAGLRAALWRVGRRGDGWAWAALPALLLLPVAAGWVSWRSLRVPLWGYPYSLMQYALWVAGGLYVAGRVAGDLGGFLWLRWRYWRARRVALAPAGGGSGWWPAGGLAVGGRRGSRPEAGRAASSSEGPGAEPDDALGAGSFELDDPAGRP